MKSDVRIKKLAKLLVNYSIGVKKGERITIVGPSYAEDLLLEIYKEVLVNGGIPKLRVDLPLQGYIYFKHANKAQLKSFPKSELFDTKMTDAFIYIRGSENTRELNSIDPEKQTLRHKILKPLSKERDKKRWTLFYYPSNALAMEADMSLEEFEDFTFSSCLINWEKESKKYEKLKKIIDEGKKVRIVGEDTDISFSIEGRKAILSKGKYNMPDGEVYIAPVEKTVEGKIRFTFPAIRDGKEVEDVRLTFKQGKVIEAKAKKNEDFMKKMIKMDNGSEYLGEFGIGTNYHIKQFVKSTIYDEKIGGTIHLALGNAYKEGGGTNKSALHWDMIKDLRKKGAIYVDGKIIQKNGKFLI